MGDAGRVRGDQRVGDLPEQRRGHLRGHGAAVLHQPAEGDAVDVLHHQPLVAGLGVRDRVEHRDHVRVVQPGAQVRLPLGARLVGLLAAGQEAEALERDLPPQQLVVAEPHSAGAAAPDLAVE
jgi:hypothetical protein